MGPSTLVHRDLEMLHLVFDDVDPPSTPAEPQVPDPLSFPFFALAILRNQTWQVTGRSSKIPIEHGSSTIVDLDHDAPNVDMGVFQLTVGEPGLTEGISISL